MTGSDAAIRKLTTLLKRLRTQHEPVTPPAVQPEPPDAFDQVVHQLVYSMLLWEASSGQSRAAFKRLRESVVDYNELRVCIADEIGHMLGDRYPLALERALRLRTTLNDLFNRQHAVALAHLKDSPKREARAALDALDGIPPFVAARVALIEFDAHALPCDERLRDLLAKEGVAEDDAPPHEVASWLERHVRHEECLETHLLLQAWSDEHGHPPRREHRRPAPEAKSVENGETARRTPKAVKVAKTIKSDPAKKTSKTKPRTGS